MHEVLYQIRFFKGDRVRETVNDNLATVHGVRLNENDEAVAVLIEFDDIPGVVQPVDVRFIRKLSHTRECVKIQQSSRYNPRGLPGCPLCDDRAATVARLAPDCPDPYAPYCSRSRSPERCPCGRPEDTT